MVLMNLTETNSRYIVGRIGETSIDRFLAMVTAREEEVKAQKKMTKVRKPKGIFRRGWDFVGSFLPGKGARPIVPPSGKM